MGLGHSIFITSWICNKKLINYLFFTLHLFVIVILGGKCNLYLTFFLLYFELVMLFVCGPILVIVDSENYFSLLQTGLQRSKMTNCGYQM